MLIKTVVSDYRCKQAIANILVCNVVYCRSKQEIHFNQVFNHLIDDYKNNIDKSDLVLNVLKAFKQLEASEVDPSLLTYSIILNNSGLVSSGSFSEILIS